jgi:two-component system cell cycle sensor histidine kinase/response regulator CckA
VKPTTDYYAEKLANLVTARPWILFSLLVAAPLLFTAVNRYFSGRDFIEDIGDYFEIGLEMVVLVGIGMYLLHIITQKSKVIQTFQDSDTRYRQLFDISPEPMVVHRQGKILLANEAAARTIGADSPQHMVGRSVFDFMPPDHHAVAEERFNVVESRRIGVPLIEINFLKSDGSVAYAETVALPTTFEGEPAVLSVGRDITKRKQAEEALKESEKKYRLLVDNAYEGIFVSQDGMLKFVNPRVAEVMECSAEELLNKSFVELIYPEDLEQTILYHSQRMAGDDSPMRHFFRVTTHTGKIRWIELESVLITWEGKPAGLCFATDITDRMLAEEALKESQKRYRDLVENANDIIYMTDANGFFLLLNSVGLRVTGYSQDEIVHKHYLDLVSPEYKKQAERFYGTQFVQRIPDTYYELPIVTKQGETVWIGQRVQLVTHEDTVAGFQAICRDITDRKLAEEALRRSEERYRAVFNNATVGINLLDREGRYIQVNSTSANMLGYTPEELQRLTFLDVTHPEDVDISKKHLLELLEGKQDSYRLEKRFMRKDGEVVWADVSVSAIRELQGEYSATLTVVVDITGRKKSEQERESLREQLLQAQKMEAIGTLAGGIAHEFNNLLTIISGYTELLLAGARPGDSTSSDLQKMASACHRGAELVQKLRIFSRRAEYMLRPINLTHEVNDAVKFLSKTISKMIEIRCDLADDLSVVSGDSAQIVQLIINLALNSQDAMPEGGELFIETSNITLDEEYCASHVGTKPGDYVLLSVADTGHGMDETTRQRIFDPFFTTRGLAQRSGLGLAVVHGIVEKHGGRIECESEPGAGTTFKVYLPLLPLEMEEPDSVAETTIPTGSETILLVDDEESIAELGKRFLARAGYTVFVAANGEDAADLYADNKSNISLVILDLLMPGMGGKQCLQELLKIDPMAKVLIASGFTEKAKKDELMAVGARGFVTKPFTMTQLLEDVRSILDSV